MKLSHILVIIAVLASTSYSFSQELYKSRSSPLAVTQLRYKDSYIKITYSQPLKRGREVFGKLVPYGQVWRFGANEATEMIITRDILINNILLKAGTYSVFAIPTEDKWTIIINSDLGLWGSYNYTDKLDVFRFDVPVQRTSNTTEAFTLDLNGKNELADLLIRWDNIQLSVPIKFMN